MRLRSKNLIGFVLTACLLTECHSQDNLENTANTSMDVQVLDASRNAASDDRNVAQSGFQELQALARSGSIEAMLAVAHCFTEGLGTAQDGNLAYQAYKFAAEQGSAVGMYETAIRLLDGDGVAKSRTGAISWLIQASKKDHLQAIERLVEEFWDRYYKSNSNPRALKIWSERGALLGSASCQRILGVCYEDKIGTEIDTAQAIHWYTRATDGGDIRAKVYLAYCYLNGVGTDVDLTKAIRLLRDAAKSADPYASSVYAIQLDQRVVANRLEQPSIDPLNFSEQMDASEITAGYQQEVMRYLHKAVSLKDASAMAYLAWNLAYGEGCEVDPDKAFALAAESESLGSVAGICQLAEFYERGIGVSVNPKKAAWLYLRSAQQGSPLAQFRYAQCLDRGWGVRRNPIASRNWLVCSATNGHPDAIQAVQAINEAEMEQVRTWLYSMFEDNIANAAMADRFDSFNREQAYGDQIRMDRLGY